MSQYGSNQGGYPYRGHQGDQQSWNSQNIYNTLPQQGSTDWNREEIPNLEPQSFQYQGATNVFPRFNQQHQDPSFKMPNLYQEPPKKLQNLKESIISLFGNLANLAATYAPSEDKEQLRDLVNQTVQDYPELESKLQVLLQINQKKINQPSKQEIPNAGCQHYGAERYTTICKQSHCKECLRELIFASPESTQQISCPCGIGLSRKNKDELAPELNPYLNKKIGNPINVPPANFAQDRPPDLKQNFKADPQGFQQKPIENVEVYEQYYEKQSPPQLPIKKIPPSNIQNPPQKYPNIPQPNQFAAQPQKYQNPLPPNQIAPQLPKKFPNNQNPQKYQNPPELPKKQNPRSGPRIDANKLYCILCREAKDADEFNLIACPGHDICSVCRANYFQLSHECPECFRGYSDSEIEIISILPVTLAPRDIKFQQNNQNAQGNEDYKCIHCGNKIAKSEAYMYECNHPLHNQCQLPTGCPVCR